ncbi:MAG TPA: ABC transporter substrate-binding protein [Actinospica sp.]|nr:ABC transporter substrate-binding protein [Actinospica sp.]
MRRTHLLAAGAAIGLAASAMAGCSSTQHTGGSSAGGSGASGNTVQALGANLKSGGTVTIANESGATWNCQFNPLTTNQQEANGFIYESLVYVNPLQDTAAPTPLLATSYTWNSTDTQLTFQIRQNVKWSDGQAFSAADVAYTFNLLKQYSAIDNFSLWSAPSAGGAGLTSVSASGDTVTMKFGSNASIFFYDVAGDTPIVPEHIWKSAGNPSNYTNTKPVGTGPFTVSNCSADNIKYTANPTYWMPNEPHVQTVNYPAYLSNDPANNDLASGRDNWGGQYIPSINSFYLSKSSNYHVWSPPVSNVSLIPNTAQGPTANLDVREAIAYALNRTQIAAIGEQGEEQAANQTGVINPTFSAYYNASALGASGYASQSLDKARTALAQAGYSTSHPLSLTVKNPTGYSDWDADLQVVKQELKGIGINLTTQDEADNTFTSDLENGNFQLAFYGPPGGPTPYYELHLMLDSANDMPVGQSAQGDYGRYKNPAVDQLFASYASATSASAQQNAIKQISTYMIKDVPLIPVVEAVDWFQYSTADLQGWPSASDPYAQPAPWNYPDLEMVLLHLYSKSAQ